MKIKYMTYVFLMLFFLMTGCSHNESVIISDDVNTGVVTKDGDDRSVDIEADTEYRSTADALVEDKTAYKEKSDDLYVFVCGHVANPGVYKLESGSRICDSIDAAGGIMEDGQPAALDQAKVLVDGQTIYVPGIDEEWSRTSSNEGSSVSSDQGGNSINLNIATREELLTLPGIGESKADDIIRYRNEHGKFESIEDIMNIQGIKEGIFNKIKDRISI